MCTGFYSHIRLSRHAGYKGVLESHWSLEHLHQEVVETILFVPGIPSNSEAEGTTHVQLIGKRCRVDIASINGEVASTKLMKGTKNHCNLSWGVDIFIPCSTIVAA